MQGLPGNDGPPVSTCSFSTSVSQRTLIDIMHSLAHNPRLKITTTCLTAVMPPGKQGHPGREGTPGEKGLPVSLLYNIHVSVCTVCVCACAVEEKVPSILMWRCLHL